MSGEDATRPGDPLPVLTRLAERCVPALSDGCTIEFRDADGSTGRIVRPTAATATAKTYAVEFGSPQSADAAHLGGTVVFAWDAGGVTDRHRELLALLVHHAVQTVALQRADVAARAAELEIRTLKQALDNSRGIGAAIGILMSLHKIDERRALAILRAVSQHHNRKLRDLAAGVVTTGWLDPALMSSTPGVGGEARPASPARDALRAGTSMACAGRHD